MPQQKTCSKCGGNLKKKEMTFFGRSWTGTFRFNTYVCEKCGFTELYLQE